MSIPENIKKHRPKQLGASEVRCIGGKYYVYLVSSRWDPEKGRPQKITGKSIGKITEADGFIPNAAGLKLMQGKRLVPTTAPVVKGYGAYEMLQQLSPGLASALRQHFPDIFREIRAVALIRLVDGVSSTRMVQPMFLASSLSDACGDIAVSEESVRHFVARLGSMQGRLDSFMRDMVMPGATLLFDGTTIFTRSSDSLAAKGYNPDHRLNTQARILYVFDKGSHRPVFYRIFQGSVVDKTAFMETVQSAGCKDCIIIADKGFYSKQNLSALMQAGMKYILPLREDTTLVAPVFYEQPDDKWDGVFTYNKRAIWYCKRPSGNKGNFIYTFRDDSRRAELVGHYVERAEQNYDEARRVPLDVRGETRIGYFSFCSNLDVTAKEIYMGYKERWDIEQCFDYLKNSVSTSASHARTDEYFRGWAFLNHMSLLYYYGLVNALHKAGLESSFSAEDVLKLTKNIYLVDTGDGKEKRVSAIQKKTIELLEGLGVDLLRKN